MKNAFFRFELLKCGKNSILIADYFKSKLPTMFSYQKKDLQTFILLLRQCVMCCEYINSRGTFNKTSSPSK